MFASQSPIVCGLRPSARATLTAVPALTQQPDGVPAFTFACRWRTVHLVAGNGFVQAPRARQG